MHPHQALLLLTRAFLGWVAHDVPDCRLHRRVQVRPTCSRLHQNIHAGVLADHSLLQSPLYMRVRRSYPTLPKAARRVETLLVKTGANTLCPSLLKRLNNASWFSIGNCFSVSLVAVEALGLLGPRA